MEISNKIVYENTGIKFPDDVKIILNKNNTIEVLINDDFKITRENSFVLSFVKNLSEEKKFEAIKINPLIFLCFKEPNVELQIAAVSQWSDLIKNIENPCLEVQLAAVKKWGCCIKYIENPCLEVQLAAIKCYAKSIKYIENPCLEVQLAAVKIWGYCIKYIENPCLEVQLAAVEENGYCIDYIKNPHFEVKRYCKDKISPDFYSILDNDILIEGLGDIIKKQLIEEITTKIEYLIKILD